MSRAISVFHGRFGRATLYCLNRPMTTHVHREGHLIFHVRGEPGAVNVCGRRCAPRPETGVAVNPWEPHDFLPGDPGEGSLFLVLYINPAWFLALGREAPPALRFGRSEIAVEGPVAQAVRKVTSVLLGSGEIHHLDGYLQELTGAAFEASWHRLGAERPIILPAPGVSDFRVRKSIRLMDEHVGDSIELDEVAREAGLSRPHFYKLFRQHTGITPNLYVNTLLMEKAIDSLTATTRSVTDIGFDLGFSSQSCFTRFFASNVGMAPTDYRRAVQVLSS
jgi:AraC-like DNA-binding protein